MLALRFPLTCSIPALHPRAPKTFRSDPNEQPQASRPRPTLPPVSGTPAELIRRFFQIQERRAAAYGAFDESFRRHARGAADGVTFSETCREITAEFASCSLEAIALEEALKAAGKEAPAACVRVAQMGEKTKLNMTCALQVLRKRALENAWSWQRETDHAEDVDVAELERREASFAAAARSPPSVAAPSFANGNFRKACDVHGEAAACACAQAARAAEPTRAEFEGAVAEATRELEDAVRGINDALEELRCELEDEA